MLHHDAISASLPLIETTNMVKSSILRAAKGKYALGQEDISTHRRFAESA